MGKRGRNQKKGPQNSKKHKILNDEKDVDFKNLDDEIDAFHKKRDMIPLDINDDNMDSNEEDDEQHIFNYEGIDGDDDDDDDDDDEDDDDDDDDNNLRGLEAKIVRQQKFLREKLGDVDDKVDDDDDDTDQDEKAGKVWSKNKGVFYGSENQDYEIQSSDEDAAEEEEEVMRLQKERAESLRPEDFGLEVDEEDDSDEEPTFGEMMTKGKPKSKDSSDKAAELDAVPMYEEVKKDLSALSRDEQMDVVYSSAPELVGLLAELNDASKQLETYINPLLSKVTKGERSKKEGLHYLEVKQLLLLAYCQAISFYLLMKSEGQPVRDHPVIARLVEIKSLLEKTKELDVHIPDGFEDALIEKSDIATATKPAEQGPVLSSDLVATLNDLTGSLPDKREPSKSREADEQLQMQSVEVYEKKRKTDKGQDQPVSLESVKMLQFRAALEEKLKMKAGSVAPKIEQSQKQKLKKLDGRKLETTGDFDDEAMNLDGARHVGRTSTLFSKLSQIVPAKRSRKGVSGDDDMPERDDLGERRWKHELRVLARAGVKSIDEDDIQIENGEGCEGDDDGHLENELGSSEDDETNDFYNQIKHQRDAKLKLKAEKYSRNPQVQPEADITVDGKRHITTQMEKNRGLTRARKKLAKNPRKKYRLQHDKAAKRRKGQVREIRQPKYSYDGEATGINPRISRSTRF